MQKERKSIENQPLVFCFSREFVCLFKIPTVYFISIARHDEREEMSRIRIPLDFKIDFLEYVVIPSFGEDLHFENNAAREIWMRNTAGSDFNPHLDRLMIAFNTITTKAEAKLEKAQAKAELERKEEREFQLRLRQLSQQGNYLPYLFSYFLDLLKFLIFISNNKKKIFNPRKKSST